VVVIGALISIVIVAWAVGVNILRLGEDYPLPHVLPLCGGHPPGVYDLVGGGILALFFCLLYAVLDSPREKEDRQRRFRHALWLVPLALVLAGYIGRHVKPSVHWSELVYELNIPDPERLSQTCVLAVTCAALVAIVAIWHAR
jgi:hypothetical protein